MSFEHKNVIINGNLNVIKAEIIQYLCEVLPFYTSSFAMDTLRFFIIYLDK